jgi:hypothetical protein
MTVMLDDYTGDFANRKTLPVRRRVVTIPRPSEEQAEEEKKEWLVIDG